MLDVANLGVTYKTAAGELRILDDVSFSLQPGEAAAVTGPSGSGKSTLLYALGGLEPPTNGTVRLNGRNPYELSADELAAFRNQEIGFVFQDHCLLPQCTLLENVLLPTLVASRDRAAEPRARELLTHVGLAARIEHRPGQLSGGERQRAAIARALIREPRMVLCDEPTGNLDRDTADTVGELLLTLHRRHQSVMLVVTHSERLAARFVRQWQIEGGRLATSGAAGTPSTSLSEGRQGPDGHDR